jgi:hypothetical protein
MECKNTKCIISIVLLVAAALVKFLTAWSIWIPIVLVVLAIAGFICKCKCKKCCSTKTEETPAVETTEEPEVEETPAETIPEVEAEKELE